METLVTQGHRATGLFEARPTRVNPLDAFAAPRRAVQRLRLKEWIGWTFMHPELSASMILQDAHYLASSEIYVRDAVSQRLTQHSATARGGSLELPEAFYGTTPSIDRSGYRIAYDLGPLGSTHRLHVDIAATRSGELPIRAELELDGAGASAPLSVSQPLLPRGEMYTHKLVFPVSGTLTVGEHTYEFRAERDLVILDEHKTFLPYRTHWLWGTFATRHEDGIVGANFCERPDAPGTPGESCLWLPGGHAGQGGQGGQGGQDGQDEPTCISLDQVAFVPESDEPLARWHGFSQDGLLDVTFTPDGRKDVKHQLVLAAIDYWQLYGTWSGTVDGRRVERVRGVMEKMDARL